MRRFLAIVVVLGVGLFWTASPVAAAAGRPLSTTLTGAAEVPGPADPDGSGTALITVNAGLGEVCWSIHVEGITLPAIAAHIHVGSPDVAGPVVVTLSPPDANGDASGCTAVDRALALAIVRSPSDYYVNVHTTDFPAGALRGQL